MRDADDDARLGAFSQLSDDALACRAIETEIIDRKIQRASRTRDKGGHVLGDRRDLGIPSGIRQAGRLDALLEESNLDLAVGEGGCGKARHRASPSGGGPGRAHITLSAQLMTPSATPREPDIPRIALPYGASTRRTSARPALGAYLAGA